MANQNKISTTYEIRLHTIENHNKLHNIHSENTTKTFVIDEQVTEVNIKKLQ